MNLDSETTEMEFLKKDTIGVWSGSMELLQSNFEEKNGKHEKEITGK